jgi:hypothetical protein
MSGFVVIQEEKLWDFVRDGFHDGIESADKWGSEIDTEEHAAWLESRARKQVADWLEKQQKGDPA